MAYSTANLSFNGNNVELPIYSGTLGPEVIDVGGVNKNNIFTFDPGLLSTAACKSQITYIDGDAGILLYRGYPIAELAEQCDFLEIAHLLFFAELPDLAQKQTFEQEIKSHQKVDAQIYSLLPAFSRDAHPMSMLLGFMGALAGFYPEATHIKDVAARKLASYRMVAKIPALVATSYRYARGQSLIPPRDDLSYAENFMHMTFSAKENDQPNALLARALDKILTLHADHEQNASTTAVRTSGSTGANPYACIAAGIAALWGPAHGGANEACLRMLQEIGNTANIPHYVARAKDKNDPFRLMGFGHRVYKNYDPRATVMRATCYEVLDELGVKDSPLFKLAIELENIALEDEYFVQRKLYPNVDFYSGITLSALGFPPAMFTPIFVLARTVGWMAQWMELLNDPQYKLVRPRQLYMGEKERKVEKR